MKSWRLPLVVLAALLLVSGGVVPGVSAGSGGSTGVAPGAAVQLNEDNNNQSVTVGQGAVVELSLPSNPTTGYIWSYSASPDQNVLAETSHFSIAASQAIGSGGDEHWVFQAVGAGTTSLNLAYARPWEKSAQPAKTYSVEIGVNSAPAPAPSRWNHASFTVGGNTYSVNGQVYQMEMHPRSFKTGGSMCRCATWYRLSACPPPTCTGMTASRSVVLPPDQDGIVYHLKIGDNNIYRIDSGGTDKVVQAMDAAPLNKDGRVYLPARFIAGLFGYQVGWDAAGRACRSNRPKLMQTEARSACEHFFTPSIPPRAALFLPLLTERLFFELMHKQGKQSFCMESYY